MSRVLVMGENTFTPLLFSYAHFYYIVKGNYRTCDEHRNIIRK